MVFKKIAKMAQIAPQEPTQKIPRTIPIIRGLFHTAHVRILSNTEKGQLAIVWKHLRRKRTFADAQAEDQ
jgi:hypothetical protein